MPRWPNYNLEHKKCPKCKIEFPREIFGKNRPYCPECWKKYKKELNKTSTKTIDGNKRRDEKRRKTENYISYQDNYRKENRETRNETERQRRIDHGLEINQRNKERRKENPEKYREQSRQSAQRRVERRKTDPDLDQHCKEQQRKAMRKYYWSHRKSILEFAKNKYKADIEKAREKSRLSVAKFRIENPKALQAIKATRLAAERGAKIDLDFNLKEHTKRLIYWQQNRCFFCNSVVISHHIEHMIPISLGGTHTANNVFWACSSCGSSKHNSLVGIEWKPTLKEIISPLIWRDEIKELPIKIFSTFFGSSRIPNCKNFLENVKKEFPESLIVFDWEWLNKQSAINNILNHKLKKNKSIYARNTEVIDITVDEAKPFLDTYHIQGFGLGSIYLGLLHENELIGVSSWMFRDGAVELNRLAFNGSVVGGFGKLLNRFEKEYKPSGFSIFSFIDPRYATGNSYYGLGFEDAGETEHTVYYYVNGTGIYHRRLFMRNNLKNKLVMFKDNLTEEQNCRMNGWMRIYGLKQKRVIKGNYIHDSLDNGAGVIYIPPSNRR